jgi:kinesin family protein 11
MTPQKRRWDYADQWERTKGRDALLREWRAGAPGAPRPSTLRSASFAAPESAPMDADADDGDAVMREPEDASVPGDEEAAEPEPAPEPEPEEPAVPTPPVRSMPRRMSSATAPSQMAPPKKLAAPKSGIQPPKSALAERSANVVANRRRLR